jgi:hypothetical protein
MTKQYLRSDRLVYRHIAGEHLLIDLRSKSEIPFFSLTESAVPLWQTLEAWSSSERLVERLRQEYDITPEQATADVAEFLGHLETIGALNVRETEE